MRIFATEYTEIGCSAIPIADTDLFSVDLVVALDGDVECLLLFLVILKTFEFYLFVIRMPSVTI